MDLLEELRELRIAHALLEEQLKTSKEIGRKLANHNHDYSIQLKEAREMFSEISNDLVSGKYEYSSIGNKSIFHKRIQVWLEKYKDES